ncbi:MAG: hypothetical protein K2K36_03310 [Muribaculaceae bacterium]|nr:hypothetical protein [Muribaculaceae bacterium]
MEFDELAAVRFINGRLADEGRQPYADDELLNVIDMIWDYYEENGLLEIDMADDDPDDVEPEVVDYVERMLRKDREAAIRPEDIPLIVRAEMDYEDSVI